jgi:hypothetical protein
MEIKKVDLSRLQNDEHFQFHTEFKDLVNQYGAAALNIQPQFAVYLTCFEQEDEALLKIMKSALTENIQAADLKRDLTFRGLAGTNKYAAFHCRPEVVAAAKRLQVVFDAYGNVANKSLNKETSAVYNLLQDLNGKYEQDVTTTGLREWVDELERNNKAFEDMVKSRYDETAERTQLVMRTTRTTLDEAYHTIIKLMEAFILVAQQTGTTPPDYQNFNTRFNIVIDKYNNTIAQRKGAAAAGRRRTLNAEIDTFTKEDTGR